MNLDRIFNAAYGGMQKDIMVKIAEFTEQHITKEPWKSYWRGYHSARVGQKEISAPGVDSLNRNLFLRGFNDARNGQANRITPDEQQKKGVLYNEWKLAYKKWISSLENTKPKLYAQHLAWLEKPDINDKKSDRRKPGRQIFYREPQMSFYFGYHQGVINKNFPAAPDWVDSSLYQKGGDAANRTGIYKNLGDSEFKNFEKTYKEWKKTILENVKEKFKGKPEVLRKQESWLNSHDVRNFDSDGPPEATDRAPRSSGSLPEVIDFGEKLTNYDRLYGDRGATYTQKRQLQKAYRDYFAKIHKWFLHYFGSGTSSDVTVMWFSGKSQSDSKWIQDNRYKVSNAIIQTINDLENIIRKIDSGKIESDILLNPKNHLRIYRSPVIDKSRVDRGIDTISSYHDKLKQNLYRIYT